MQIRDRVYKAIKVTLVRVVVGKNHNQVARDHRKSIIIENHLGHLINSMINKIKAIRNNKKMDSLMPLIRMIRNLSKHHRMNLNMSKVLDHKSK